MGRLGSQRGTGTKNWILASASPRRSELLRAAGQCFECMASGVDETPRPAERAIDFALRIARNKAREISGRRPADWVLAADTVVVVDGQSLGKPRDAADATTMLERLSGRHHEVITAFVLLDGHGEVFVEQVVTTEVVFRPLDESEIATYVSSGEPFDKAGAYAIQGGAAEFVIALHGSHSNVIGLPMDEVESALRSAGLWIGSRWS
jgi:septum formation protein